ncbi:hypothetical protein LTR66_016615 [Elasticomyces elasticus]|nr:hypothetical protein LTR66_016615 [Elasticomyces elasticus]
MKSTNSPPAGLTPNSNHSLNSPNTAGPDARTTPPNQPGSAGSSQNGRGMKVHDMLGNPQPHGQRPEHRASSDNDMLNKLDRKK